MASKLNCYIDIKFFTVLSLLNFKWRSPLFGNEWILIIRTKGFWATSFPVQFSSQEVQNLNVSKTAFTSYRIIRTYIYRIDKSDVLDPAIPFYYLTIVAIHYRKDLPRESEGVQVHDVHVSLVRSQVQPFGFECWTKYNNSDPLNPTQCVNVFVLRLVAGLLRPRLSFKQVEQSSQ